MKLLAFDTAQDACSVALYDTARADAGDSPLLARSGEVLKRGHAERLVGMIEQAMAEAGQDFAGLDRLAVTVGPGTFTGVRIGLATARGFALATGLPLVGLDTLRVIAGGVAAPAGACIASVTDARRGEVYLATFEADHKPSPPVAAPALMPLDAAAEMLERHAPVLVGSGAALLAGKLAGRGAAARLSGAPPLPAAAILARLAAEAPDPGDALPAPLYLRAPDARLPGPAQTARTGSE